MSQLRNNYRYLVRFQVLTASSMKIRAFWDIAPCSLVGIDLRFRSAYCLHHHGDIIFLSISLLSWESQISYTIITFTACTVRNELETDNIKIDPKEVGYEHLNVIQMVHNGAHLPISLGLIKTRNFLTGTCYPVHYGSSFHEYLVLFTNRKLPAPLIVKVNIIFRIFSTMVVEWFALLLRIWKDPGSNLGPNTNYTDWDFSWFPQSLQAGIVPQIMPLWLPSKSFTIHHSLNTLSFDAL
jgi:hypothetical protein